MAGSGQCSGKWASLLRQKNLRGESRATWVEQEVGFVYNILLERAPPMRA